MKGENIKAYIDKLVHERGIPYIDFYMSVGHECVFRYYTSKDGKATGKEMLNLFSATKPVTVCCAMRLIEDGKLSLDDEVGKYIPEYQNAYLLDEKGNKVFPKSKMTVEQLFTMSAGLSYRIYAEPYRSLIESAGEKATAAEIMGALAAAPLLFEPGERFEYSLCHDLLAAVVERASGKRFSAYVDEVVCKPLGMKNSGFHLDVSLAETYFADGKNIVRYSDENNMVFTENYDSGGAGLVSCVEDYARFAQTLACGGVWKDGYRLLSEDGLLKIRTCRNQQISVQNTFTCVQGSDYGYGLGVRVRTSDTDWGLKKGEFGWDGAAGTYLMVDPEKKISVVIGMQLRNWPEVFTGEHLKLVEYAYKEL